MAYLVRTVWAGAALFAIAATGAEKLRLTGADTSTLPVVRMIVDPGTPGSLKPADFQLLVDGKPGSEADRVRPFGDLGIGMAVVVALDVSGSMKGQPLAAVREGLAGMVSRKRESDRVAIMTFADDVRWESKWDATTESLKGTFEKLEARGTQTRLLDAMVAALDELERQDTTIPVRRCLIVFSDGHDEGSEARLADVVRRIQSGTVRVDAVGLTRSDPYWFDSLRQTSAAGFGEFRPAATAAALRPLLGQGIDRLLESEVLEFRAPDLKADGRSHQLGLSRKSSSWRSELAVAIPEVKLWNRPLFRYVGIGVGVVALALAGLTWRRARQEPPRVAASPSPLTTSKPAAARAASVAAVPRTPTRVETAEAEWTGAAAGTASAYAYAAPLPTVPAPPVPELDAKPTPPVSERRPVRTVLAPRAGDATSYILRAETGSLAGQTFALDAGEFWVGSRPNNHLALAADPAVSGNHACFVVEPPFVRVFDHGSLNGTWVNDERVGESASLLREGDRIQIGQSVFVVQTTETR